MADSTPVAASVKEIRAAFPKMSDTFVLGCIEKNMPMAQVAEAVVEEQQRMLADQEATIAALEAEIASRDEAQAKAEAEAKAKEEAEAKAKAAGNQPVQTPGDSGQPSALARWNDAIADGRKRGLSHQAAAIEANRRNPGLREQMLAEINAR